MSTHGTRVFASWVQSILSAGGVAVGLNEKPSTVPAGDGWAVVIPIAGGITSGSIENPYEDVTCDVQVSCFGSMPELAFGVLDRSRALILASTPATLSDGRRVLFVTPGFGGPNSGRDDDVSPPLFHAQDRFTFRTSA